CALHPELHPFPTRRSSDLLADGVQDSLRRGELREFVNETFLSKESRHTGQKSKVFLHILGGPEEEHVNPNGLSPAMGIMDAWGTDRKSTRLNSSHLVISYA